MALYIHTYLRSMQSGKWRWVRNFFYDLDEPFDVFTHIGFWAEHYVSIKEWEMYGKFVYLSEYVRRGVMFIEVMYV